MADVFQLSAEHQQQLSAMTPELNAARQTIEKMKRAGLDVSDLEARLQAAIQTRDGFLREFGKALPTR